MKRLWCLLLCAALVVGLLSALAPAAFAEGYPWGEELTLPLDGAAHMFIMDEIVNEEHPEWGPEIPDQRVWFMLDETTKLDFEVQRFGDGTEILLEQVYFNDEGEEDGQHEHWYFSFPMNTKSVWPQKLNYSTYLHKGVYRFTVRKHYYSPAPMFKNYAIKAKATEVMGAEKASDVAPSFADYDVRKFPVAFAKAGDTHTIQDALGLSRGGIEGERMYQFTLNTDLSMEMRYTGSKTYMIVELFRYEEPNPDWEGDDGSRRLYGNAQEPLSGTLSKAQSVIRTFPLKKGTYYLKLVKPRGDLSAAFGLKLTAKRYATPKIALPKTITLAEGAWVTVNPYGAINNDIGYAGDWSVQKDDIAEVYEWGELNAKKAGSTKLYLQIQNGKKYTSTVKVVKNEFNRKYPLSGKGKYVYISVKSMKFNPEGIEVKLFLLNKTGAPIDGIGFRRAELLPAQHDGYLGFRPDIFSDGAPIRFPSALKHNKYTEVTLQFKHGSEEWDRLTPERYKLPASGSNIRLEDFSAFNALEAKGLGIKQKRFVLLTGKEKGVFADKKVLPQFTMARIK